MALLLVPSQEPTELLEEKETMGFSRQLPLFTRAQECQGYLNPDRQGYFGLLFDRDGQKWQRMFPLIDLVAVLGDLDPTLDTWCSQAEFFGPCRRINNLARLDLLFLDLDTYRVPFLRGRPPRELVYVVHQFCSDEGLPAPSVMVFSGRGLQLKWLLEKPIPQPAVHRWNAVQVELVRRLASLGADPLARDASRVLRVVQTTNSKSGEMCRVVDAVMDADRRPIRYNFESLSEELLPVSRKEIEDRKRQQQGRQNLGLVRSGNRLGLRRFCAQQLAWDRVQDLRRLLELRGGAKEGERMLHLFWQLNFLLLSDITNIQRVMWLEAQYLAKELDPRWNYRSAELGTLYRKAKEHRAGVKVEFQGRRYPALYTPTNGTLINQFQITDDEQRQMQTIISSAMAAERHRAREETRRREAGMLPRADYLASLEVQRESSLERERRRSQERRREKGAQPSLDIAAESARKAGQAHGLRDKGLSIRQIAAEMAVSKSLVAKYLKCPLGDRGVPAYY